jgi:hypothetical protein
MKPLQPTEFENLAVGHLVRFRSDADGFPVVLALQNFWISETFKRQGVEYFFSPFGFAGITANIEGTLEPSTISFPNNAVSQGYLTEALNGHAEEGNDLRRWRRPYFVEVDACVVSVDKVGDIRQVLFTYSGQANAGEWDDTSLVLELSSVLDAVIGDLPARRLNNNLVGTLPITSNVNLR